MNKTKIDVKIGEFKIGEGNQVLHAILGSCVGVSIFWPDRKIYALSHCLLPYTNKKEMPLGGRYVNQAIDSMLKKLEVTKSQYPQLQAIVTGGGNMTKPKDTPKKYLIGCDNSESAITLLKEYGINIKHQDVGGLQGRKIAIDCLTGEIEIKTLPRTSIVENTKK